MSKPIILTGELYRVNVETAPEVKIHFYVIAEDLAGVRDTLQGLYDANLLTKGDVKSISCLGGERGGVTGALTTEELNNRLFIK